MEPGAAGLPQAILFDLDGVLASAKEGWFRAFQDATRAYATRPATREEFNRIFTLRLEDTVRIFQFSCGPRELERFIASRFARYVPELAVNNEAQPLLRLLRAQGVRTAVVSNTVSPITHAILSATGMLPYLDLVVCADQVDRPKPAPDLVRAALRRLGLQPNQAWMVGDSPTDLRASHAAGVRFWGLGTPGDETLGSLSELFP